MPIGLKITQKQMFSITHGIVKTGYSTDECQNTKRATDETLKWTPYLVCKC